MTAGLLALCALLVPFQDEGLQEEDEGFPLDWIKAIDEADLSWWPDEDIGFELSGNMEWEFHGHGKEAPGLTVEDPSYRTHGHRRFHNRSNDFVHSPDFTQRTDLWLESFFGDHVNGAVMGRLDRGPVSSRGGMAWDFRMEQGFLRAGVPEFMAEVGKFSAPVGNFIPRHQARTNPMVTWPLPYDSMTTLEHPQDTKATILGRRDKRDKKDWRPILWREMYGYGVMAFGAGEDWEYATAVMTSAPASWPWEWSNREWSFRSSNYYGRAAFKPDISTKIGASYTYGPYAKDEPKIDERKAPQQLVGLDFEWSEGDVDIFAEVFYNKFRAPNAGNLVSWSWYVEAKYQFMPGLFGAARVGQTLFDDITDAAGVSRSWDRNITRYELGAGYFFTRNFFVKTTMQENASHGGREPDDWLWSTQFGLTF